MEAQLEFLKKIDCSADPSKNSNYDYFGENSIEALPERRNAKIEPQDAHWIVGPFDLKFGHFSLEKDPLPIIFTNLKNLIDCPLVSEG